MLEFTTVNELLSLAEEHLPKATIDGVLAGAGSELTLRRNRHALERLALEQRLLTTVGSVDLSTVFLGVHLEHPMITAPMGSVKSMQPDGDVQMAVGAGREGGLATVANGAADLATVGSAARGPLLAQLRCTGELGEHEAKLAAIHADPRYVGICVTVDGPVEARLDRFIESAGASETGGRALRVPGFRFTWADIDRLRAETSLPLGLKGIMHPDDANEALEHGADFLWISNHGARKFDSVRATIDVLDEVVAAVADRVPLVVDGGFRHGSDACLALAMGATLVAFGKLSICALGIGGEDGVANLFAILKEELHNALACAGIRSIGELGPDAVRRVEYRASSREPATPALRPFASPVTASRNGESPSSFTFSTIRELFGLAELHLPSALFDFIRAGAGSELALARNRGALEQLAIEEHLLARPGPLDISTDFLGIHLESPILTAPMGMVQKVWPAGDIAMALGAVREGSLACVANETGASLEQIADAASGPLLAQFRSSNGPEAEEAKLAAVHARPQYCGICITVDGPVQTRVDRFIETGTALGPGDLLLRVPGHRFTWDDIDRLRNATSLPMGLKGILDASDALAAINHGADFVWVSNHGARKLDAVRATIDVLGEVIEAVEGRVPVVVDSGFARGSDVLKALAVGASLVAMGKASVMALGLGGADGVSCLLRILNEELVNALAGTGRLALAELSSELVRTVDY